MIIEDVAGRPVPAMKVFGTSIKALMNHVSYLYCKRNRDRARGNPMGFNSTCNMVRRSKTVHAKKC
jgi:hypothetical protein